MTDTIPYGCWPSRISGRDVAASSLRLGQPRRFDKATWWLESRPEEKGRSVIVCQRDGASAPGDMLPPPFSAQSRVNEYGGGPYTVHEGDLFFVNKSDQDIWRIIPGNSSPQRLTDCEGWKFADLVHDPLRELLYAVAEIDRSPEPEHRLVAIDTTNGRVHTLSAGEDFYSSPTPSPTGTELAWLSWSHPRMPWDGTRLWRAPLRVEKGIPCVGYPQQVAGGDDESVVQPQWLGRKRLGFVSDRDNWWNLYHTSAEGIRPLFPMEAEFGLPHWVYGMRSWSPLDDDRLACAWTREGKWEAGILDIASGDMQALDLPVDTIDTLDAQDGHIVVLGGSATRFNAVLHHDGNTLHELRTAGSPAYPTECFSQPEAVSFATGDNETAHGLYYPPTLPGVAGPDGSAPPLLVKCHGGPTAATTPLLDMKIQYWTSRGFAVLDVNYRGSTGYGRGFRRALYGRWGQADVEDAINGARAMAREGKADAKRLLVSGSSAGGYTVLNALTFHDVFAAGASYYGVADPESAMRDTEKFESRYGDSLIGPLPESRETWQARSPLLHARRISCPVIFLQGLDDPVVPPDQSERMCRSLRENGVATAYLEFPGEGHGFRQASTIESALDAEYAFYCRVLGLEPQLDLPRITIHNLD
ncbi:MAG: prolyl oligopeptidase family serine peptidase [Gammaproteobacteria bacterium]|nr:prolyl oligopeptidase family serine peptidase [Gammaproteobacteria bacterium]